MKKEKQLANLLDLKPKRNAEWETTDEGKVVVLVPKFRNPFLVKWVLPYLSKPYFRIKLDDIGSAIWQQLDGGTPISHVAENLKTKFGAAVEPVESRINHFLNQLERGDLVTISNKPQ
ncbi:MAG: PqqD family protein [Bacteroidota bacterium]